MKTILTVAEIVEIAKLFKCFGIDEQDESDFLAMAGGARRSPALHAQLMAKSAYRQCARGIIEVLGRHNAHLFQQRVAA